MRELNIALFQSQLYWEDPIKNKEIFEDRIRNIERPVDLIVLPEMFSTGFSMNAQSLSEYMDGATVHWMKNTAENTDSAITGSLIIRDNSSFYNRMIWMWPDGSSEYYDKRHLFRLAKEHQTYISGRERKVVNLKEWRFCLNICYDLRFPVWSRNRNDYDILLNVANWPEARIDHWKTLLKARAIENMCYAIGLNRVGYDGNGIYYSGDSSVIHPNGEVILSCNKKEEILYVQLNMNELNNYRERFGFYKDADEFELRDQE